MLGLGTAAPTTDIARHTLDDEDLARRSGARLLISAGTASAVEAIAHRIHTSSARADFPFVHRSAGIFPSEPGLLTAACANLLDAANGGSLLLSDVETMPSSVQEELVDLLDALDLAHGSAASVRLVAGTTVELFDRVVSGRFSERLFYRLNVLHLMASGSRADAVRSDA
jgi:DNA-binding NtrC family response regulator